MLQRRIRLSSLSLSNSSGSRIWRGHSLRPFTVKRKKNIQWSILQHYRVCFTPFFDFTQSIRSACSFAQINEDNNEGYIFVFGLPYVTNRISINSEHDIVNVRLLSIFPPDELRPYFQDGYLAGTEDLTTEYESKTELDFKKLTNCKVYNS